MFEKYFKVYGPQSGLKCRKMISIIHLPSKRPVLAKFRILTFWSDISNCTLTKFTRQIGTFHSAEINMLPNVPKMFLTPSEPKFNGEFKSRSSHCRKLPKYENFDIFESHFLYFTTKF